MIFAVVLAGAIALGVARQSQVVEVGPERVNANEILRPDLKPGSPMPPSVRKAIGSAGAFLIFKTCLTCSSIDIEAIVKASGIPNLPVLVPQMPDAEFRKVQAASPGVNMVRVALADVEALNPWFDPRAYIADPQGKLTALQSEPHPEEELGAWIRSKLPEPKP